MLRCLRLFWAASRRSICRGLMASSCRAISGRKAKRRRIHGIHCGTSTLNLPKLKPAEERLQPYRPGIACGLPDLRQHRQGLPAVAVSPSPPTLRRTLFRPQPIQQTDGVFPVVIRVGTEFAQNHFLGLPRSRPIAAINRSQVLPPSLVAQPNLLQNAFWLGYILNGATLPPSVTF